MSRKLLTSTSTNVLTALPSSPVDGQEIRYQSTTGGAASMQSLGIVWSLRYRALNADGTANANAYKWEFVGGSPLAASVPGQSGAIVVGAGAVNTWLDAGPLGPSVTLPLAGDYMVQHGSNINSNQGGAVYNSVCAIGVSNLLPSVVNISAANLWASVAGQPQRITATALRVLRQQYQTNTVCSLYVNNASLSVTPVAVG